MQRCRQLSYTSEMLLIAPLSSGIKADDRLDVVRS